MLVEIVRTLWPIVAAIYLLEGLVWVRTGHWLFASTLGARYRRLAPGLRLASLLPVSRLASAHRPLLVPAADSLAVATQPASQAVARWEHGGFKHLPWEQLLAVERETNRLLLAPGLAVTLPSPRHAEHWHRLIARLAPLPSRKRRAQLDLALAQASDHRAFEACRAQVERPLGGLPGLASLLFLLTFVALPAVAYGPWLAPKPLVEALVLVGVMHLITFGGLYAEVKRLRRLEIPQGRGLLLELLLSPPALMLAATRLGKDAYAGFDHLTIAAGLLPREELITLARGELYSLETAIHREAANPGWVAVLVRRREDLLQLLKARGITAAQAQQAPAKRDPLAVAYCPACAGEYDAAGAECSECGLPVVTFP